MNLPLQGIRVLDLTHRLAGPTMTMMMGDWGADVLKLEWWKRMDAWRGVISIDHDVNGEEVYNKGRKWLNLNRNKRSLTLNLKTERGKQIFFDLVKQADVVADNFSANVMNRLGLGYDVLCRINPGLVMISMPGLGSSGPHTHFVSNGATIEGYAGLASMTGYKDGAPRNSVGIWPDPVAGVHGAIAVALALVNRNRTGRGQCIELAQSEATMNMIGDALLEVATNGTVRKPEGNSSCFRAPYGVYPCRGDDAWISIVTRSQEEWFALKVVAGDSLFASNSKFTSIKERLENSEELDKLIGEWTKTQDAWKLAERLQRVGVEAAPVVSDKDFATRRDLLVRGFVVPFENEHLKQFTSSAARINGQTPPIRIGPPRLGEHTTEILSELLQLTDVELSSLASDGII